MTTDVEGDFEHETRIIRRWINHQTVATEQLGEQLMAWARYVGEDPRSTTKQRIWKILVNYGGANAEQWDEFNHHWPGCGEFRFMGVFGFGGKIFAPTLANPHPYVTTYPEVETWMSKYLIKAINKLLEEL